MKTIILDNLNSLETLLTLALAEELGLKISECEISSTLPRLTGIVVEDILKFSPEKISTLIELKGSENNLKFVRYVVTERNRLTTDLDRILIKKLDKKNVKEYDKDDKYNKKN